MTPNRRANAVAKWVGRAKPQRTATSAVASGGGSPAADAAPSPTPNGRRPALDVVLTVNGAEHRLDALDAHATLLGCLRDGLHLTGTKKGCGHGQCGACTVLADGRRVLACLTLAAQAEGRSLVTVEGLAAGAGLARSRTRALEAPRPNRCNLRREARAVCRGRPRLLPA